MRLQAWIYTRSQVSPRIDAVLTTEHSQSHYGQPVIIADSYIDGDHQQYPGGLMDYDQVDVVHLLDSTEAEREQVRSVFGSFGIRVY